MVYLPRWHVLDGEFAVLVGHGEIRTVHHRHPREHPLMHIALEFQKFFRLVEGISQIRATSHLDVVMRHVIRFGIRVDIVNARIGIF